MTHIFMTFVICCLLLISVFMIMKRNGNSRRRNFEAPIMMHSSSRKKTGRIVIRLRMIPWIKLDLSLMVWKQELKVVHLRNVPDQPSKRKKRKPRKADRSFALRARRVLRQATDSGDTWPSIRGRKLAEKVNSCSLLCSGF